MEEIKFVNSKVEVSELPHSPKTSEWGATEATVYHTMISHDSKGRHPSKIWESDRKKMKPSELQNKNRLFLEKVIGEYGHTSCGYQTNIGLVYEIPRHTTMFLCSFDYSKYLQQSLRYTKAGSFTSSLRTEEVKEIFNKQNNLYNKMIDDSIKKEDARYVLPLASTSHIHQNTNFISLANIFRVLTSEYSKIPELSKQIIEKALKKLNQKEPDLFRRELIDQYNLIEKGYPIANIFSNSNKWVDEIKDKLGSAKVVSFKKEIDKKLVEESKNLNDQAFTFLNLSSQAKRVEGYITKMSLSAWHQFMRQDTVKQSVESIYDAVERGEIIVPDMIKESNYEEAYLDLCQETLEFYEKEKSRVGEEKAIEIVPHALSVYVAFSPDGYNILSGFMHDRIQEKAQWEIRSIAKEVKNLIAEENPTYGTSIG